MDTGVSAEAPMASLPDSASGLHAEYSQRRLDRRIGPLKQFLGITSVGTR